MSALTADKDRDAVLRAIDFKMAIINVMEGYQDLGAGLIGNQLVALGHECVANAYLPVKYAPPTKDKPHD